MEHSQGLHCWGSQSPASLAGNFSGFRIGKGSTASSSDVLLMGPKHLVLQRVRNTAHWCGSSCKLSLCSKHDEENIEGLQATPFEHSAWQSESPITLLFIYIVKI